MTAPWPLFTLPAAGPARALEPEALPLALILPGNVVGADPPAVPRGVPRAQIIAWSGWMGGAQARPSDGYFPPDFRTWSTPGRKRFDDFCDAVAPALESRGLTILFRPHARHVLSDPQACISFLSARRAQPFGLILDPAGFITSAMLSSAEDHLTRAFEALAGHPAVAALGLTNLETIPDSDDPISGPELRASPLADGLLPPGVLAELAASHWPPGRPVLLLDPAADAARLAPTLR